MTHRTILGSALVAAAWLLLPGPDARAQADLSVTECTALVRLHEVTLHARVCNGSASGASFNLGFYIEPDGTSSPTPPPEETASGVAGAGGCTDVSAPTGMFDTLYLPNGKYALFCEVTTAGDPDTTNNLAGPEPFAVGPDLWVYSFWVELDGDTTKYKAVVCNTGTDIAHNFRVGFYFDRTTPPTDGEFSNGFKDIDELRPAYWGYWFGDETQFAPWLCEEVEYKRVPTPNDSYDSWCKVDEGLFVDESNETNNVAGPYHFTMSNADLVIKRFDVRVEGGPPYTVYYDFRICNIGTATAGPFWADIYYDRSDQQPPALGEPGQQNKGWASLPPGHCVDDVFTWEDAPETSGDQEYESWLQVDPDKFVYDPDRNSNLEGPLHITVPGGLVGGDCPDADGDGFGVGVGCPGGSDCNDANPDIHPLAAEVCGDGVDQNCNETPDDGCPGVDCVDQDGDGWPAGPDCIKADCDDTNPNRFPTNPEVCDDHIDQDCDGIPDDCCPGSNCCDQDGDGFGVGTDCPGGQQDCDDTNPAATVPGAEEICGDNQDNDCDLLIDENCPGSYCTDADNDGYGVGVGCIGIQDPDDTDPNIPATDETCGDGIDNDANGVIDDGCPGCVDVDGDGYGVGDDCLPGERDCNEQDPEIHPGATEVCDLVDNNCNFTVDEGTPGQLCPDPECMEICAGDASCEAQCLDLNCVDNDGDGWGSGPGCAVEDCDDNDPAVHPGAEEVCDLVDNDCDDTPDDGTPDNPCPNVECARACGGDAGCIAACPIQDCLDSDGDGYGVGEDCVESDPDDSDPSTWPGAPEICGDGRDQSGDGVVDEGCVLCKDFDGDGYGVGPYCDVRDCNDDDPAVHPGAEETCGDKDLNCDARPPVNSACKACACNHPGGNPVDQWPTTTLVLLVLVGLLRRRRA